MNHELCDRQGCECLDGFEPVLGGSTSPLTQAAEMQLGAGASENDASDEVNNKIKERSPVETDYDYSESYTSFDYSSTDPYTGLGSGSIYSTAEKSDNWVSHKSQGCSENGLGHHAPANTPYKASDVQDIDWSAEKACWIADDYVRYCDIHWRTDSDSPGKCLKDCQNHEHCHKATWFLQEHESSAGEPVCFMFSVGAKECEWDGGQYVRPAQGQSIECEAPVCDPDVWNDCWENILQKRTYCKYTKKSDKQISDENEEETGSDSWPESIHYAPSYTANQLSEHYEYRCSACPKTPAQCIAVGYTDNLSWSFSGDSEGYFSTFEDFAECLNNCFNMDFDTCHEDGCNCVETSDVLPDIWNNFYPLDQFGSIDVSGYSDWSGGSSSSGSSRPFASWDSAGCGHYDKPEQPEQPEIDDPKPVDVLCSEICDIQCATSFKFHGDACRERCNLNCNNEMLTLTDLELAEAYSVCNSTDDSTDDETKPLSLYDSCIGVCDHRCDEYRDSFPNGSVAMCQKHCMRRCFEDTEFLILNDFDLGQQFCNYTEYFEENGSLFTDDTTDGDTKPLSLYESCTNVCDHRCSEDNYWDFFPHGSTAMCQKHCMRRCFQDTEFLILNDFDLGQRFCNYTEYFEENGSLFADLFTEPPTTSTTTTTATTTTTTTVAAITACDNSKTYECPANSVCIPTENLVGYSCQCYQGYYMSLNKCRLIVEEAKSQESTDRSLAVYFTKYLSSTFCPADVSTVCGSLFKLP